jgi:hypothetical protein
MCNLPICGDHSVNGPRLCPDCSDTSRGDERETAYQLSRDTWKLDQDEERRATVVRLAKESRQIAGGDGGLDDHDRIVAENEARVGSFNHYLELMVKVRDEDKDQQGFRSMLPLLGCGREGCKETGCVALRRRIGIP